MLLLQHMCSISRKTTLGTNGRKSMQVVKANVSCLCLPMNAVAAIQNGFDVGTAWNIYFNETTDIQVGDRVVANNMAFIVKGKMPYLNLPIISHIQVSAVTENANG